MFAKHLSIEDGDAYELVTDPEWERVGEAIKEMNGKEHTIICLEGESKIHMTIGGGPDVFVVYASGDQETFFTAWKKWRQRRNHRGAANKRIPSGAAGRERRCLESCKVVCRNGQTGAERSLALHGGSRGLQRLEQMPKRVIRSAC